jgi:hypothetical protein
VELPYADYLTAMAMLPPISPIFAAAALPRNHYSTATDNNIDKSPVQASRSLATIIQDGNEYETSEYGDAISVVSGVAA